LFRLAQIVAYYAKKQLKKIAFYGLLLKLTNKMYQKYHFEQNYTCREVVPTSFSPWLRMTKCIFFYLRKKQETFTRLFKQTSTQTYILNIEVFHDILTFA
jgi:hypothetical protein